MKTTTSATSNKPIGITEPPLPIRVALLASYIPPNQLTSYQVYSSQFQNLTIILSTAMERHRAWVADWDGLDVQVQKTWTFRRKWRHTTGFTDSVDVHVPTDTFRLLRKLSPDIIVSSELGFRSLISAFYTFLYRKTPLVLWACVSEHTEQGRGRLRGLLRGFLVRRADAVIVNGASGRRYMESLGSRSDRVFEIPYCTAKDLFDQCPIDRNEEQSHRLIIVGQLVERKGVAQFLESLSSWASANASRTVSLTIVGDGPLRSALQETRLPMNLKVEFVGVKTHQELATLYANSGILVFPTLADEWGLVVNEAMAAALPVLGSLYSGAVEELCEDGETGWVFRPDHKEEVTRALDLAFNCSIDQLNEMRQKARARVAQITPAICANRLRNVVKFALERADGINHDT
jgi:glycosyltransferase involved in cell wall biosynthesis